MKPKPVASVVTHGRPLLASTIAILCTLMELQVKADEMFKDEHASLGDMQQFLYDLRNLNESVPVGVWIALQETADKIEALSGIKPVPNTTWQHWRARLNRAEEVRRLKDLCELGGDEHPTDPSAA